MHINNLAPCGVVCDVCLGFQREKNRCVGCNNEGNKPYHCTVCSIKTCLEKSGNNKLLCIECDRYPCRRLKDLNKRYLAKYGENLMKNLIDAQEKETVQFFAELSEKWTCKACGQLLCVHSAVCPTCGSGNTHFPIRKS